MSMVELKRLLDATVMHSRHEHSDAAGPDRRSPTSVMI